MTNRVNRAYNEAMKIGPLVVDSERFGAICVKWGIVRVQVFGSVLREDFGDESDVDLLVDFAKDSTVTLFDLEAINNEFEGLLRRKVDIVTRRGVMSSENAIRRSAILDSAVTLYADDVGALLADMLIAARRADRRLGHTSESDYSKDTDLQ